MFPDGVKDMFAGGVVNGSRTSTYFQFPSSRRGRFAGEPAVPRFSCLSSKVKLVVVSWSGRWGKRSFWASLLRSCPEGDLAGFNGAGSLAAGRRAQPHFAFPGVARICEGIERFKK